MKIIVPIVISIVCLITVACASAPQYLDEKPYVIYPQNVLDENSSSAQKISMQALLDSFADYRWEIHGIDQENGTITAEVCRRGQHCVEVLATVKNNGSIEIIKTPGQKLSRNESALLRRWLANVKKAYKKHTIPSSVGSNPSKVTERPG